MEGKEVVRGAEEKRYLRYGKKWSVKSVGKEDRTECTQVVEEKYYRKGRETRGHCK